MHTACMSRDLPLLKYLVNEVGIPFNNKNKPKPPFEFLFGERDSEEIVLKKWKPAYSIDIHKGALEYLNWRTTEFSKEPLEFVVYKFNDIENEFETQCLHLKDQQKESKKEEG